MKKILVIYTSVGLGHKVIAENIAAKLREYPGIEVEMLDILKFYGGGITSSGWVQKLYVGILTRAPWLWQFFYNNKVFNALTLPLRIPVASLRAAKLDGYLQKSRPDLILTTETIPTALVSYLKLKNKYRGKLVTTFSDYHFQPYWVYPRVDQYLGIIPEHTQNVPGIIITGMPISDEFYKEYSQQEVLKKYGFTHGHPVIALMAGSRGWGVGLPQLHALLSLNSEIQIAAFTGTNEEMYAQFSGLAEATPRLKVFREVGNDVVAEILSAADILVTKPGGLTMSQAVARGVPMVLTRALPGGEELNMEYFVSRGAALAARDTSELKTAVKLLLSDRGICEQTKQKMKGLLTLDAAEKAAAAIVDILRSE